MPLVAIRKLRQTWPEAIASRAGAEADRLLARYDAIRRDGIDPATAAYQALEGAGLLWRVDEPGPVAPSAADPDDLPAA